MKMPQEDIPALVQEKGIFPGWHMDAKYWISMVLENEIPDERVMELVAKSWFLTEK